MTGLIPKTWRCDVCGLPDPYNGQGDGIGSCDCPRCDGACGVPYTSVLCGCPDDDDYPWIYDEEEAGSAPEEIAGLRPGEPPKKTTTVHLPEDR